MNEHRIGRREALKVMGAAVVAGSVSGCGAIAGAGRVVLSVAWKTITSVISAVLKHGDKVLTVVAMVEAVRKELSSTLTDEQANSLKSGGKLYLKPEDGKEHAIPYTVN